MDYVKICGLKKVEDIQLSIEKGASAIGFIYNVPQSPRNLEKDELMNLLKVIPKNINAVVIFRANSADEVKEIMNDLDVNYYQVHCNFNIRDLDRFSSVLKKKLIIALKANQAKKEDVINKINLSFDQFFAFLIDNSEGSGTELDYDLILEIRRRTSGSKIILAGGINTNNVELLIKDIRPYGIDVSSSLESERGVKDPQKIKEFLEIVNYCLKNERE